MKSIIEQNPATKNQITNNKPDVIKNSNILQGYIGNSFNGGHYKTLCYMPIMAGTKVANHNIRLNIKMITPKTPVYQKLKLNLKTFFVPNSRVWDNWEKFEAQKGGATTNKIKEIPNIGGKAFSPVSDELIENSIEFTETDIFRDSYVSSYIPKYQTGLNNSNGFRTLPKYSILPIRGFKAIYNDYLRNKEYEQELQEFKEDTVSLVEWASIGGLMATSQKDKLILRGRRQNSYYTDYRTELLGNNEEYEFTESPNMLSSLNEYTKFIAEARSEAENAQLNDWDIIAKIRGSRKLTEGKVQLLGTQTVGLNYQHVTQDTYNTNDLIKDKNFQVMGEQGAYCYTELDLNLYQMQEFIETGYIHVIAQVTADTVFETGFDRIGLNVGVFDIYRPDMKEMKDDVLYEIEKCGTRIMNDNELNAITGYKRKFSEYFKCPNCISGDITTGGYYETKDIDGNAIRVVDNDLNEPVRYESKKTFQFFETDDKETGQYLSKNIWQDYTDELINRNQAITNEIEYIENLNDKPFMRIKGENQFICLGMQTVIANLPIDENIKNNYTKWGER